MAITDELCRSFLDLWWHFDPAAATQAGIPGYDGRLGAFDPVAIREHLAAIRSIAGAVEDLEVEETADEIDRTALLDHLRVLLFRFEHEHPYEHNPALWLEHLSNAFEGLLARGPEDPTLSAAALDRLRALPAFLSAAQETLEIPPRFLVETALAQLPGVAALLTETVERFGAGWLLEGGDGPAALAEAGKALHQMELALGTALAAESDPHAVAIGEDEVDRRLHYEHASIHNGAESWRGALRLAREVEQEVGELAAALDPARPWREVYEWVRAEQPADLATAFLEAIQAARHYAESRGFSPSAAPLAVAELSLAAEVLEPVAAYRPGGYDTRAAILLGEADPAALPWIAARLGVPGVHLHRSQTDLVPGLVRRHIAATSTPLGWGLYAQELMAELGFGGEPELRLIERVLLLRDAHLAVVDLGLHTKQLSAEEAVAHLVAHLPIERPAALADVRRVACRPLSACAAILGRLELRRLRTDAAATRGQTFSLEAFHREVFSYGGLPVPLIRWGMGLDA